MPRAEPVGRSKLLRCPWLVLLLMLVPFAWLWLWLHLLLRPPAAKRPWLISHRGAAAWAPENTLAGVSAALELGAHYVEVDVQRSADGVLTLMHDATVQRTTGDHGRVSALSWDRLRGLDAGSYFGPQFAGEPVASLDEVLTYLRDRPATLVVDLKDPGRFPGIEHQLAAALDKHGMSDRSWVISFDHYWLARFQQLAPQVSVGKIYIWMGPGEPSPPGRFVDVFWACVLADPTLVRRARAKGYSVVVWTVNHPWLMRLLVWLGVDGITSDWPDLWRQVVLVDHG